MGDEKKEHFYLVSGIKIPSLRSDDLEFHALTNANYFMRGGIQYPNWTYLQKSTDKGISRTDGSINDYVALRFEKRRLKL